MNKKQLLLTIIIIILLTITITSVAYSQHQVLDKVLLEADVTIIPEKESLGFTIDADGVRFGEIPLNRASTRNITVSSIWEEEVMVQINSHGYIKEWIRPGRNNFILQPGEETDVSITIILPSDAELGYYTGKVSIIFLRV